MICPSKLPLYLMSRSDLIGQASNSFVQFHASRECNTEDLHKIATYLK